MSLLTKIPPPVALAALLSGAVGVTRSVPLLQLAPFRSPLLAVVLGLAVVVLEIWGWREFRRHRTTILPLRRPTSLLCVGPFRFTRNPLYLTMLLLAVAVWVGWGQLGLLLAPLGFFAFVNGIIIPYEEAKLRSIFGDAYTDYCRRVRRWL